MFKIFDSGHALPEEREAVHDLLTKNDINFFETPDSIKTRSAFWVHNEDDYRRARSLISLFQAEYARQSRQKYKETLAREWGGNHTNWLLWNLRKQAALIILILAVLLASSVVLYFR